MNYLVAGAVLLPAFFAGLFSYIALPRIACQTRRGSDSEAGSEADLAAVRMTRIKDIKPKTWLMLLCGASVCAVSMYFVSNSGVSTVGLFRHASVSVLLLSVAIIDWKTHLIPNVSILISLCVGAVLMICEFVIYRGEAVSTLISCALGLLCCLVVFYVLARLTKGGISMGDVKLIAVIGWILGLSSVLVIVLFAMILCAVIGIFLMISKKKHKNDQLAFAPFLFLGYSVMSVLLGI